MVAMPYIKHKLARKRAGKRLAESRRFPAEPLRLTGAEVIARLEAANVIGAWSDRQDIEDSSAYARKLREQAQNRERT